MTVSRDEAIAHVVFDNDGTLVDSEGNFLVTLEKVLPKYLNRDITLTEIEERYIPDWIQLLKNLGIEDPNQDLIQEIISDVQEINKDFTPTLYPGIKELIAKLHAMKIATYVWTGRESKSALEIFKTHGMTDLFCDMQFFDTSTPKPDPDGLNRMLGNVEKSKIVLIGDSIVDIKGAKGFNIPCLIVDWSSKIDHNEFLGGGATKIVSHPQDIIEWVESNLI